MDETGSAEATAPNEALPVAFAQPSLSRADRARALALGTVVGGAKLGVGALLTAGLVVALVFGGLFVGPTIGMAAYSVDAPPRRPPIIPPDVPIGAREDWAVWSYVDKINQAWGKDWSVVIEWFEQLDARYPGNPMVLDKLYVSYIEAGRTLQLQGDLAGARRRFEQAADYDPDRGAAQEYLAELDKLEGRRR